LQGGKTQSIGEVPQYGLYGEAEIITMQKDGKYARWKVSQCAFYHHKAESKAYTMSR